MLEDIFSIKGRVALVTGGSRGIGEMIARGFVEAGAKVYISSRNAESCDATAAALGPNCISLPEDVSTLAGVKALAQRVAAAEPKLDILVNNAGASWAADFDEFSEADWDRVMDLNLKSPFFLTQQLHGLLKAAASETQPAKVINIVSIDGIMLAPRETYAYQASKSGLIYLTRRMAAKLVHDRIAVTAIAPGAYPSDMNSIARDDPEGFAKRIPMGRVGRDRDIAACAVFLASHAGDYIVGATIPVDGGSAYASFGRLPPPPQA